MTDLDALAVEPLSGPPSAWLDTVRSLCVHVRDDAPSESAAVSWLCDRGAASRSAAERQLAFLDAAGLLSVGEACRLDEYARRLLAADTDANAAVLYRALSSVRGFDAVVDALGVRPLTDVEILDLLETELAGDIEATDAEPLLQWLVALGYLTRDGGLNKLTRAGKRRSEGIDGFRERADAEAGAADTSRDGDSGTAAADDAGDAGTDDAAAAGDDTDTAGGADAAAATAERTTSLPEAYDYQCMLCADRRQRAPGEGYAELYRPMPPSEGGPESDENAVVVCPNHRADLEHGLVRIDPQTLVVDHAYEASVDGRQLAVADDHDLGVAYLAYHNDVVADIEQ